MSEDEQALVPVEETEVRFYEDMLTAVLVDVPGAEESQIYIPVKPISDALGLSWSGQYERLQRDEVLSDVSALIRMTRIVERRGNPEQLCLPLEFIPGWLFGISASRVKASLRDKILRYRRECYRVLAEAFREGRLTESADLAALERSDLPAAQAYRMAMAVADLARNQMLLEHRLTERLEAHEARLEQLEDTLGRPDRQITPEQASQISQAVKSIAMTLSKRTGRNEYGGVYGEFYRRFGITSYKLLPANQFDDAIVFLSEWHQSLTGDAPF
jgi:hypothetical protein